MQYITSDTFSVKEKTRRRGALLYPISCTIKLQFISKTHTFHHSVLLMPFTCMVYKACIASQRDTWFMRKSNSHIFASQWIIYIQLCSFCTFSLSIHLFSKRVKCVQLVQSGLQLIERHFTVCVTHVWTINNTAIRCSALYTQIAAKYGTKWVVNEKWFHVLVHTLHSLWV